MQSTSYKTLYQTQVVEVTEKKSKFIATAVPVDTREAAEMALAELRKQYKDATHNVFAYRIKEPTQIWERQSDDGEPSGTAGMPILDMLRGEDIVNVLMVVTRYYGGTLLGTGGLVRAYGHSAKLALVDVIEKTTYALMAIQVEYPLSGKVEYAVKSGGYELKEIVYAEDVTYLLYLKVVDVPVFTEEMESLTNGTAKVKKIEETDGFFYQGAFIIP